MKISRKEATTEYAVLRGGGPSGVIQRESKGVVND